MSTIAETFLKKASRSKNIFDIRKEAVEELGLQEYEPKPKLKPKREPRPKPKRVFREKDIVKQYILLELCKSQFDKACELLNEYFESNDEKMFKLSNITTKHDHNNETVSEDKYHYLKLEFTKGARKVHISLWKQRPNGTYLSSVAEESFRGSIKEMWGRIDFQDPLHGISKKKATWDPSHRVPDRGITIWCRR